LIVALTLTIVLVYLNRATRRTHKPVARKDAIMRLGIKRAEDMTPEELAAHQQRRADIRGQILDDQRTGAGRDDLALERERKWFHENGRPLPDHLK
jgi:hypothetical protein